jgi:nucleoside-diphosphate-sugar epimerase
MTQTVLILGGKGKIGAHAAQAFWNAGWQVRMYDRGTDMTQAAMGADVIVNGLNPPRYHNWAKLIPAITAQVIAAAKASGATVIIPGNVYNFGNAGGEWSEHSPQQPQTRKGKIRVQMERDYAASGVQTIILRAGNFIDPDHNGDIMSVFLMTGIAKGKLTSAGPKDIVTTYCYLPDWAQAAVGLAEKRAELAQFEDVPFPGHVFSVEDLRVTVQDTLGRPVRLSPFPWWIMTLASPFWELARELSEMRYLWTTAHTLSGSKLTRLLPDFRPTDLRQVMLAGLPVEVYPNQPVRAGTQAIAAQ